MSATRPWVDGFAREMERKLSENRHKGDRDGWMKMTVPWLLSRLDDEVRELKTAYGNLLDTEEGEGEQQILDEAADVANFAMMIADVAGGLLPRQPAGDRT